VVLNDAPVPGGVASRRDDQPRQTANRHLSAAPSPFAPATFTRVNMSVGSGTPVHEQVLEAAACLADARRTFRLRDVVAALPHLNPGTVRTHVASRCCVNAPAHHQTRWRYFRSLGGGMYRIEPRIAHGTGARRPQRRGWQDAMIEARDWGIDPTLITENLRLTPTERLERLRAFTAFVESARAANAR